MSEKITDSFPPDRENGNWIATYTGEWIEPLNPKPERIHIEDIAHSLALQCRFTGHTSRFYSTAQHSVHVSEIVPEDLALWGLLHDASEAYVSDVARPVKHSFGAFGDIYRGVEEVLAKAVAERFELVWPEPAEVKVADKMMLRAEQRDLMPNDPNEGAIWDKTVTPWGPEKAERKFLDRFAELAGNWYVDANVSPASFVKAQA